jgi:hypothetical protein
MSPLAFDKQGKPFAFQRRTKQLRVRLFRNPSARGTCCQVLDADGQPLYVDPETDYMELRKAVGHVPGLYRLDQCDEEGNELDDAQAAYVSIDIARNAQVGDGVSGDVNPLIIIQQMAAIQADVMKTMATQQAALMAATAEILRAPYRPAPIAVAAADLRNSEIRVDANDDGDEDDEDDEINEELPPESTLISVARMVDATMPNMAAQLGEFLYDKVVELLAKKKAAATAPAMPAPPAMATQVTPSHDAPSVPVISHAEPPASVARATSAPSAAAGTTAKQLENDAPTAAPEIVAATTPTPTPSQMAHLFAIRERLDTKERAIAEAAIGKMTQEQLAHWLAELCTQSVEDATATIRALIAQIRPNAMRPPQP